MMLRSNRSGFTVIEGTIVAFVVVVVAAIGWLAYDRYQHRTTSPLPTGPVGNLTDATSITYPGKSFTFSYPNGWKVNRQILPSDMPSAPDGMQGELYELIRPDAPKTLGGEPVGIYVSAFKSGNTGNVLKSADGGTTIKNRRNVTIDGYTAMFQQNVPINTRTQSSTPSSYTEDNYAVTHDGETAVFTFLLNQSSIPAYPGVGIQPGLPSEPAFNEASLLPTFNAIVTSIKF